MIIAIDGPAGAGKSTVCKLLAQKLCFLYLDTGAMYRSVAWALLKEESDLREDRLAELLPRIPLFFSIKENKLEITYLGKVLEEELRNPEISDEASRVSRLEPVRTFLVLWQRRLGEQGNIVAEGRDTATVVFPKADLKVYLTASLQARAGRRLAEYLAKGIETSFEEIEQRIRERDQADTSRDLAPMRPAEGAVLLDTSHLDIPEVVDRLIAETEGQVKSACTGYQEL
ncbi:MAG: (d)CMP kinase [Syntrophobacteraceae bacterium]